MTSGFPGSCTPAPAHVIHSGVTFALLRQAESFQGDHLCRMPTSIGALSETAGPESSWSHFK